MKTATNPKTGEVLGFNDEVSDDEIIYAIDSENNGEIAPPTPTWYDSTLGKALSVLPPEMSIVNTVSKSAYTGVLSTLATIEDAMSFGLAPNSNIKKEAELVKKSNIDQPFPSLENKPTSGTPDFVKDTGSAALSGMALLAKTMGASLMPATNISKPLAEASKNIAALPSVNESKLKEGESLGMDAVKAGAEMAGSMLVSMPTDIAIGTLAKSFMVGRMSKAPIMKAIAPLVERIHPWAIGMGTRGAMQATREASAQGKNAFEAAGTGIVKGAEETALGQFMGAAGSGIGSIPSMGLINTVMGEYEALRTQGRFATKEERIKSFAEGIGMGAVMHAIGAIPMNLGKEPPDAKAAQFIRDMNEQIAAANRKNDRKTAEELYDEMVKDPLYPKEWRAEEATLDEFNSAIHNAMVIEGDPMKTSRLFSELIDHQSISAETRQKLLDVYSAFRNDYLSTPDKDIDLVSQMAVTHMVMQNTDSYVARQMAMEKMLNDVAGYYQSKNSSADKGVVQRGAQEIMLNEADIILMDKQYVYSDVKRKLVDRGFNDAQADAAAIAWSARAEVAARNQGMTPAEWYAKENFTLDNGKQKTKLETHIDLLNQSTIGDLADKMLFMGQNIESPDNPLNLFFQQDKLKWDAPHKEPIFGVVNNRLSKELEVLERLIGQVPEALQLPGKYVGTVRELTRSIRPHDLGANLMKMKNDGRLARLLDEKIDPNVLGAERGLSGKELKSFIDEVATLRDKTDILSNNGKAEASLDLLIATCQPTTPCQECYASASMIRMSAVKKAFRNTALMLNDPIGFAKLIASEVNKTPKTQLPFVRLQGSGDMTMSEAVDAYNELAKHIDRPIHIFSRHHDNLAKLVDGKNAPFKKMGSVDAQLYDYYGKKYLYENKKKRGIDNAWLFTSKEEIPKIEDLFKHNALSLILATEKKLHNALPMEAKKVSCPCDADERTYFGSCRRCATSSGGCWMSSVNSGIDSKGKIWDITDAKAPKALRPLLESMFEASGEKLNGKELDPRSISYAKIVADQARKSIELINLYHRNYRRGDSNTVVVKDIRFPGDAITLVDIERWKKLKSNKGKPVPESTEDTLYLNAKEIEAQVQAYKERMQGVIDTALKGGTFYLPGGEIQKPIGFKNWKRMSDKEVERLFQEPTPIEGKLMQGHRGYVELAKEPGSLHKIVMGAKSDISTFMHESAHIWLSDMHNLARSGQANEKYMQDWGTLKKWLGIAEDQTALTTKQHEKFARGFEKYLREGKAPVESLRGVFEKFKEWLTEIYANVKQLHVALNDDVRRVMDNMLAETQNPVNKVARVKESSQMLVDSIMKQVAGVGEQTAKAEASVQPTPEKASPVVSSEALLKDISQQAGKLAEGAGEQKPVKSSGEVKESRAFLKIQDKLGTYAENNPTYNRMNIANDAAKGLKLVAEDIGLARKVALGMATSPADTTETAVSYAYVDEMIRQGNFAEAARAETAHSLRQTRRGQEIVAEKGRVDVDNPEWFMNQIIQARLENLGRGIASKLQKSAKQKAMDEINRNVDELKKRLEKIKKSNPEGDQSKLYQDELTAWAEKAFTKKQLADKDIIARIKEIDSSFDPNKSMEYIADLVSSKLDIDVTGNELKAVQAKVDIMNSKAEEVDQFGLHSDDYWKARDEVNKLVQGFVPAHNLVVLTSLIGRGNMLASIASPLMNIESNAIHLMTQGLVRRAETMQWGSNAHQKLGMDYIKTVMKIFSESGYDVSRMVGIPKEKLIRGEHIVHSQGKGAVRAVGRVYEDIVFKYMMGAPDVMTSAIAFTDRAMLEARAISAQEKLKGVEADARVKELFLDATKLEPMKPEGKAIREAAILDAQYTTFTNKGKFSEIAMGLRNALNEISDLRIGDQLMPFIKTPANVVQAGVDYSGLGSLLQMRKLPEMIREFKKGNIEPITEAMPAVIRGGLGMTMALILVNLVDPDDFTPDFASLTPAERNLARVKGAPFNSVKIGGKYVSLDYLSVLGTAFVGMLYARKFGDTWQNKTFQYLKGSVSQAAKIPGLKEFADTVGNVTEQVNKAKGTSDVAEKMGNVALAYAEGRLIPRIWNHALAFMDGVKREKGEKWWSSLQAEIPGIRQKLPPVIDQTSGEVVKETPMIGLFAGSRIKIPNDSPVVKEVSRLSTVNEIPSIGKLGLSGRMKELKIQLGANEFAKAQEYFGKEYYRKVERKIGTYPYSKLPDDKKKEEIDKIRRDVIDATLFKFKYKKPKKE